MNARSIVRSRRGRGRGMEMVRGLLSTNRANGKNRQQNNQKDQHRFASHLTLRRNVLLGIKGNPLLSVYKPISRFYIGRETVIQIARFVTLVCCINYVVIRVIKIVLLASLQLVFPLDELSNILLGEKRINK